MRAPKRLVAILSWRHCPANPETRLTSAAVCTRSHVPGAADMAEVFLDANNFTARSDGHGRLHGRRPTTNTFTWGPDIRHRSDVPYRWAGGRSLHEHSLRKVFCVAAPVDITLQFDIPDAVFTTPLPAPICLTYTSFSASFTMIFQPRTPNLTSHHHLVILRNQHNLG
jgi:hypothetical protein